MVFRLDDRRVKLCADTFCCVASGAPGFSEHHEQPGKRTRVLCCSMAACLHSTACTAYCMFACKTPNLCSFWHAPDAYITAWSGLSHTAHASFVSLQVFCSKVSPNCTACPLQTGCEYALSSGKKYQSHPAAPPQAKHQVTYCQPHMHPPRVTTV